MHAQIPEACKGNIPHVKPFHLSFPVTSEYFQTRFMAIKYSMTEEKWIPQVGIESALSGSLWVTHGREVVRLSLKSPTPKRKGECASKPREGPVAQATAKTPKAPSARYRFASIFGGIELVEASLKPRT